MQDYWSSKAKFLYLLHTQGMSYARLAGLSASAGYLGYKAYKRSRAWGARGRAKLPIRNAAKIRRIQEGYGHEMKTHDLFNNTAGSTTGVIFGLSLIAQGDTSLSREGLQIKPKNMQYRFRITQNTGATTSFVRIMIFRDKDQTGVSLPTVTQLMESDSVDSFTEHDTRPRFTILRDMVIPMSINGASRVHFIKGMINLGKRSKIWYLGTAASQGSQGKNNLYCYVVSSEAVQTVNLSLNFRLRYTEA